ncbi:LolA family protein [Trichloromonas sp.]|uniref:LolA family protein n=1 Tax=Trichloromonas sp. TaxID=3069249 RepID=UPI002A432370|nr:outer membrane lipoprotein carrier protein LolA [Trichloromonas sp.]
MKQRLLVALLCWVTLSGSAWAEEAGVAMSDVIRAVEEPFKASASKDLAIRDFEADFFQESRIVSLDRVQNGSGRVLVKFDHRSGDQASKARFRWNYDQPTTQEIVSDGETVWVYLPDNNQVIQSDIEQATQSRSDDPVTFLTGLGNLSRDFQIGWAEPNRDPDGHFILELRPRRASPLIQRLLLVVNREAVAPAGQPARAGGIFPLLSSTVFDPSGNSTIIEFSAPRVNGGIPDSTFRFILPAGVEVIRPASEGGF